MDYRFFWDCKVQRWIFKDRIHFSIDGSDRTNDAAVIENGLSSPLLRSPVGGGVVNRMELMLHQRNDDSYCSHMLSHGYGYVCIRVLVCSCVYAYARVYVRVCARVRVYVQVYARMHVHAYVHACAYACIRTHTRSRIRTYACVRAHAHTYV